MLANAGGTAHRPQSSHEQHGRHHRDRDRLSRQYRGAPKQHCADRRDSTAQWLQHGGFRQVARDAALAGQPFRPDRFVAHPFGLRKILRLHGRRDQSIRANTLQDMSRIEIPRDPHYHLMTDMADKAIGWVEYQKSLTPDKPFFIYFAPGA